MSALEKPSPEQLYEPVISPAESAGIFLSRSFQLGPGAEPPITELVPKIQALEREGRLIAQIAIPGMITIQAWANAEGDF